MTEVSRLPRIYQRPRLPLFLRRRFFAPRISPTTTPTNTASTIQKAATSGENMLKQEYSRIISALREVSCNV